MQWSFNSMSLSRSWPSSTINLSSPSSSSQPWTLTFWYCFQNLNLHESEVCAFCCVCFADKQLSSSESIVSWGSSPYSILMTSSESILPFGLNIPPRLNLQWVVWSNQMYDSWRSLQISWTLTFCLILIWSQKLVWQHSCCPNVQVKQKLVDTSILWPRSGSSLR